MEEPKLYTYILMRDGKDKTFRVYGTEERCEDGLDRLLTMGWELVQGLKEVVYVPEPIVETETKKMPWLQSTLCAGLVNCKLLWKTTDGVSYKHRWNWIDNLLYWLEGLR